MVVSRCADLTSLDGMLVCSQESPRCNALGRLAMLMKQIVKNWSRCVPNKVTKIQECDAEPPTDSERIHVVDVDKSFWKNVMILGFTWPDKITRLVASTISLCFVKHCSRDNLYNRRDWMNVTTEAYIWKSLKKTMRLLSQAPSIKSDSLRCASVLISFSNRSSYCSDVRKARW